MIGWSDDQMVGWPAILSAEGLAKVEGSAKAGGSAVGVWSTGHLDVWSPVSDLASGVWLRSVGPAVAAE